MSSSQPYRVLARKYRPQSFAELIGQDPMVQTLGNAIKRDRLAHAFLLTGVRGVGKTSTARLIAKALNCMGADGDGGPTIAPCNVCEACVAITEGRHIDVVEMDAASNTGVDHVREIIEAVRYSAVSARYKIYIVDEVHMLSRNAFNALLKTLEEPPPHVKFLFATTEVNKVPVTVLSRCQRFDLRRVPVNMLTNHFASICLAEGVEVESEALAIISRVAEGSVRDGLSILDQAIAHAGLEGGGKVTGDRVRAMLGLADHGLLQTLLHLILDGNGQAVLAALGEQYRLGVDPVAVLRGLLGLVHAITVAKVGTPPGEEQSEDERAVLAKLAATLSHAMLHRLWQLLLKGHEEVGRSSDPIEAADMALLRVVHAASLPDPGELARKLRDEPASTGVASGGVMSEPTFTDLKTMVEALGRAGRAHLAQQLHDFTGLVTYAPPVLALRPLQPLPADFARDLTIALKTMTGGNWKVSMTDTVCQPSLLQQERAGEDAARAAVLAEPLVRTAFEHFPDAELVGFDSKRSSTQ